MNNEKINEIGKMLEVNHSDIKKKSFLHKINPWYWVGQVTVFIGSLWYSLLMRHLRINETYPFESGMVAFYLSPLPLSLHVVNGYFSITKKERFGAPRGIRILTFLIILFLSVSYFVFVYINVPVTYQSNVKYGVFNQEKKS